MQLHIDDIIFRWTRAGTAIIPLMKYSTSRVTINPELINYFNKKPMPKFYL